MHHQGCRVQFKKRHDNTLVSTALMLLRGECGGGGCLHGNVPTVQNKNHLVGKTFHPVQ